MGLNVSGAVCRTSGMPTGQGWWWWLTNKPQAGSWPPRRLPSVVRIRRDARVTVTRAIYAAEPRIRVCAPVPGSSAECSLRSTPGTRLRHRDGRVCVAICELRHDTTAIHQILADPRLGGPSETPLGKREEVGRQPHQPLRVQWSLVCIPTTTWRCVLPVRNVSAGAFVVGCSVELSERAHGRSACRPQFSHGLPSFVREMCS